MHGSKQHFIHAQRGVSLSGLIFVLALLGFVAIFALKVFPSFLEYRAIKNAIVNAKSSGGSVREMQQAFSRNAEVNAIDSVNAKDLVISKETGETEISFAYEKRVPLVSNVSLVIDYSGTTAKNGVVAQKAETAAQ